MRRIGLVFLLSCLLAACSPQYNWRSVSVGDGAVTAFFPDKPQSEVRSMSFDGHELSFSMTSVAVGDTLFAVAYAPLPEAMRNDTDLRQRFAHSVMVSLYENFGQAVPEGLPAFGKRFIVEGTPQNEPVRLQASVWLTEHMLAEGLIMGPVSAFPQAEADEFLQGIKPAE